MWPKRGRYVAGVAALVQEATGGTVEIAYVDQGYTGEVPRHPVGCRQATHREASCCFAAWWPNVTSAG